MDVKTSPDQQKLSESERREFLARAGRIAVTAPAAATLLLAAGSKKAHAYGVISVVPSIIEDLL